jgi:hypothetical protein
MHEYLEMCSADASKFLVLPKYISSPVLVQDFIENSWTNGKSYLISHRKLILSSLEERKLQYGVLNFQPFSTCKYLARLKLSLELWYLYVQISLTYNCSISSSDHKDIFDFVNSSNIGVPFLLFHYCYTGVLEVKVMTLTQTTHNSYPTNISDLHISIITWSCETDNPYSLYSWRIILFSIQTY